MKLDEINVREYAESLVAQVRAGDEEMASRLDFSERSVWALEALIRLSDEKFADPATPAAGKELTVFYAGCYLGETLSRNLSGVWRFADDYTQSSVVFPFGDGGLQVFPFQKLIKRVTDGVKGNDLVDYFEGLQKQLATA
ncbi:MAG: hypothetical protein H8F28_26135 [Fibrella sp.]|nr:hypothetical protein [Armatimonadota bacterium]